MGERTEWRVVCADGNANDVHRKKGLVYRGGVSTSPPDIALRDKRWPECGPHRVQSRTVTTSEWVDADVKVEP